MQPFKLGDSYVVCNGEIYGFEKLKKELGDVAWYLAEAAQGLNVPLSEILQGNLSKLHGRYPNGFSSERSMHRENAE